jgi:NUMOD3 motif
MNEYYVYQYIDPITKLPFYIGKGSGDRMYRHLQETKENTENRKKYAVIKGLQNKGYEPIIDKIADNLTEEEAYNLEAELIEKYGRRDLDEGGILTNICTDNRPPHFTGENHPMFGKSISEKTRQKHIKLRDRTRGKTYEEIYGAERALEIRAKLAQTGENNPFYGKKHNKESRVKMSAARKGKPSTRLGSKQNDEARLKIQMNNPNRRSIHTPDGIFLSAEQYANTINTITANGLRNILKNCDKPITLTQVLRSKLFNPEHVGKTPRELGYYNI